MPNTYTQLYIHCVFAVKWRAAMLHTSFDHRLRQYITAIVQNRGHKMLAINNMPDHMHLFVGLNPTQSISELMQHVKGESSEWVNNQKLTPQKFNWQAGYAAFSHSRSQLASVVSYIQNQEKHHQKTTFLDEYKKMLQQFEIDYDDKYLFTEPE